MHPRGAGFRSGLLEPGPDLCYRERAGQSSGRAGRTAYAASEARAGAKDAGAVGALAVAKAPAACPVAEWALSIAPQTTCRTCPYPGRTALLPTGHSLWAYPDLST